MKSKKNSPVKEVGYRVKKNKNNLYYAMCNFTLKPNPQPLPYQGRGARIKASLRFGERFGEGF